MCEVHKYAPWTFFVNESTTPSNWLANLDAWPKIPNNMPIWQPTTLKLSMQQINRWEAGRTLEPTFLPPTKVPPLRYWHIYIMRFGPPPNTKQYDVTIGIFPTCTCVDFITMMASSLGGHGKWVHYKHLYFILQNVMYCGQTENFIHFSKRSWNEVQHLMSCVKVVGHK
jgi:hypothetical protein